MFSIDECNYILDRIQHCNIQYDVDGIYKYLPTFDEDPELRDFVLSKTQKPGYTVDPLRHGEAWCIVQDSVNAAIDLHADGGQPDSYQTLVPIYGQGTSIIYNSSWPTAANFVASKDAVSKDGKTFEKVYHRFGDEPFDIDQYHKYCSHIDYDILSGLEIETVYHWKVGDIFNFQRQKVHSSGKSIGRKIGITLLFNKTV